MRWVLLFVVTSGCSIAQAVDQGTRTVVAATVDEINRATTRKAPDQPQAQPGQTQVASVAQTQPTATGRQTKALFAVLDFKNRIKGKDADSVDSVYFANQVRAAVKKTAPQARVMTRENVIVLLQSQGKSLSDCEGECEVDTGRNLGADMVVSGDLIKIGGT